ncbi:MAG TPA: two-component sensor histidine kinase, partial [Dehalococcoidia bacterium]|nr:two-component sensor histidine kinase [Dehalococcoidia bacterium]
DESKITNVLDRFTKGHSSKGSGLGLALVKQQAEIHGGEVTISNISSGGTKVQVTLPIIISKD